jgi:hypothetical protein
VANEMRSLSRAFSHSELTLSASWKTIPVLAVSPFLANFKLADTHSRSAHFGLVAVSLRVQQTAIDSSSGILDAQYRSIESRACIREGLGLDASSCNLWLRSTLEPQRRKVCFIVKSGIGLGDLRLCLL